MGPALIMQASGQVQEAWLARYDYHGANDSVAAMALDSAGNIYVTGGSSGDYATVKVSPSGAQLWAARYGSSGNDEDRATAIAVDGAGNVYVTGASTSSRYYEETYCNDYGRCTTYKIFLPDYATVKYNSTGRQQWVARFECYSSEDTARAIAVDSSGNVIVTGTSGTVKYDVNGSQLWFDRSGPGITLAVDSFGSVYVSAGYYYSPRDLIKYAANGARLWTASGKGGTALALDAAGQVYVTGFGTRKFDPSGNELWASEFGGSALRLGSDGDVYLAGAFPVVGGGSFSAAKLTTDGRALWVGYYHGPATDSPCYGGYGADYASAAAVDATGNVYVTGSSVREFSPYCSLISQDLTTVKFDAEGKLLWAARSGAGIGASLAADNDGNVYVNGTLADSTSGNDYVTIKYVQNSVTGLPSIITQPQHQLVRPGTGVALSVTAVGNTPLTYQWRFNGKLVTGATNSILTLPNVGSDQAGQYSVQVSNALGVTASPEAFVTILDPLLGQSVIGGVNVTFTAPVTGTAPLYFQWQFNGTNLPGATQRTLALTNVSPANAGGYTVVVTSFGNSLTSTIAPLVVSSVVRQGWAAGFSPSGYEEEANAIAVDNAGNVYVTGHLGYGDIGTVKYDAGGNRLWSALYAGVEGRAIAVDNLGNSYVTGITVTNGDFGSVTIKYDASGNQLWATRYDGAANGEDGGLALTLDSARNIYVAIYSASASNGFDYVTAKYDNDGNQLWAARYDGPGHGDDFPWAIAVDAAGNVHVTGESVSSGTNSDYATIKYDPNGNQLWSARYNGPGNKTDFATLLTLDAAGSVYVSGTSDEGSSANDFATIKYAANGTRLWVARYNGPGNNTDNAHGLAVDSAGNVYVSGSSVGAAGNFDYAIVKYDANGSQRWVRRYDGTGAGDDYQRGLVLDHGGNVYVSGYSYGGAKTDSDFATLKYDADGHVLWVARYDGPLHGPETVTAIAVDNAGNIYVTGGGSPDGSANQDYATVKYEQSSPAAFRLTASASLRSAQFTFTLLGEAGRSYTIQASTNLVNWTVVTNFLSGSGTNQFTDATVANFNRRFYRAISP